MNKGFIAITGASSGIGKTTAETFLNKGYNVLLMARRVDRMEEFKSLPNAMVLGVDVVNKNEVDSAIKQATAKFGEVLAIVNNAGCMLLGNIIDQNNEEWIRMNNVNVLGVLNGMQAVLPSMVARQTGTIINISSIAGRKAFADHAAYVGTKFAVTGISENVRSEVASKNVRVVVIEPGVVETELLGHTTSDDIKAGYNELKKTIGDVLSPQVIADTILFVFEQPQSVNIREVVLSPTRQEG